jgi:phage gp46-like protein
MSTPSSQQGHDIALGPSPSQIGRFGFVRGADNDVVFDDTRAHSVMASVIEKRAGYWADPTHGSELYRLRSLTSRTPSQAEAAALDGLDSMVKDGSVQDVAAIAQSITSLGKLELNVAWDTPSGEHQVKTVDV